MARLLICTVGTSLLTNPDGRPWGGWRRNQPLPPVEQIDLWLAGADAVAASAETNTLQAIGLEDQDRVVLLHSDTPEGRFCSERLETYFQSRCRQAEQRSLAALGYHHASFAQAGLKSLVAVTLDVLANARRSGLQPVLCATGGFKAEIAFLNLLGALLDVEVCYIHEQFRSIVRLPRLPLNWDVDFVVQNQDFFEWIDAEPRPSLEVESWLRGRPSLRPLIDDADDGCSYLNAAGDLLYRAARQRQGSGPCAVWPKPVARPPSQKNGLSTVEHHRPKGWERLVQRLCEIDCVEYIRFDTTASGRSPVKVLDTEKGVIGVCFGSPDNQLPLAVETTARAAEQCELVAEYLRNRIL